MAKRYYKKNEKVWVKELKKTAKVKELNIPNLEATIELYIDGKLTEKTVKFMEIDKLNKNGRRFNKNLTILVKYFDGETKELEKIPTGDWIDLRSAETIEYKQGDFIKLPLGIAMSLPFEYEAHVAPRGSTFKNFGVIQTNSVGVVDESYRGNDDQWFVPLLAMRDGKIEKGDRVCQFRIMSKMPKNLKLITVKELKSPNRGGHGSTGVK